MIKNLEHINREKVGFCLDRVKFNKKITLNNETILKNHINENSIKNNSIIENKQKIFNIKTFPTLILLLSIFFFISTIAFAIPNSLTIQGKLTNLAGTSQVGTFNFTFKIYDNITSGNELWAVVNQSVTTDANGIYDVILTGINLSFADQYYLGIAVQGENESTPRINLTSAPYSFRANTSEALNPNASYFVRNLSISGNATIGDGTTTLAISTQTFNLTTTGTISLASNITLGDKIVFRLGEIIDNLVDGWLKVTGALNVTSNLFVSGSANISGDLVVNKKFNVTASSGNVNVEGTISAGGVISSRGQELQQEVNAFKRGNVSDYLGGADVNASLIKSTNTTFLALFSRVADAFSRVNLTDFFGDSGFNGSVLRVGNISNILSPTWNFANNESAVLDNATILRTGNISNIRESSYNLANFTSNLNTQNASLWNRSSTNTVLRFNDDRVGIGTTAPGQALHVVGSANVSATINAPVINTTLATQNITITSSAGSVIIRLG